MRHRVGGTGKTGFAEGLLDMADHLVGREVDDAEMAPAILVALLLGMSEDRMRAIRGDSKARRAEAAGLDIALDSAQRAVARRIERLLQVKHGHRTGMAMLEGRCRFRRRAAGMVNDIGAALIRRDRDRDRLAARNHGLAVDLDIRGDAQAIDHRLRRPVIGRINRLFKVDDQDDIVPAPAREEIVFRHDLICASDRAKRQRSSEKRRP